jgi:undecaprenyl diphosphate synthase
MRESQTNSTAITPLPVHVAVIMDGNVRWAEGQGKSRMEGHRTGTENIRRVVESFVKYQVKYLTLYAFSTENWSRPESEVRELMHILGRVIRRETKALHEKGIRLHHLGRIDRLSERVQKQVRYAIDLTKDNPVMTLSIAFDYGGRAEILNAARQLVTSGIAPEMIDEERFSGYLYSAGLPDPDLIIRTAGEVRLSNFLLWQSAYSEFYFTPVYWPDFDEEEVRKALIAYSERKRNFGG